MEVMYGNNNLLIESGYNDNPPNTCNLVTFYNHKQFDKYNIFVARFLACVLPVFDSPEIN